MRISDVAGECPKGRIGCRMLSSALEAREAPTFSPAKMLRQPNRHYARTDTMQTVCVRPLLSLLKRCCASQTASVPSAFSNFVSHGPGGRLGSLRLRAQARSNATRASFFVTCFAPRRSSSAVPPARPARCASKTDTIQDRERFFGFPGSVSPSQIGRGAGRARISDLDEGITGKSFGTKNALWFFLGPCISSCEAGADLGHECR